MDVPVTAAGSVIADSKFTQVVFRGGSPVLLYNTSPFYSVYLSTIYVSASAADLVPLAPLTSIVFDGSQDIYVTSGINPVVQVNIYPSASYITSNISDAILFSQAPFTRVIPSLGTAPSPVLPVSAYSSYDLNISAYTVSQSTPGASLTLEITLMWYEDSTGLNPVYSETWWSWLGNSSNAATPVFGSGPHHGAFFQVLIVNTGLTQIDYGMIVYASTRNLNGSSWRQQPPGMMNSGIMQFLAGNTSGNDNVLGSWSGNTATAGNTYWQPLPLASSYSYLHWRSSAVLNVPFIIAFGNGLVNGGITAGGNAQGVLWIANNIANQDSTGTIIAPRGPLYAVVQAGTSDAVTYFTATSYQGLLCL